MDDWSDDDESDEGYDDKFEYETSFRNSLPRKHDGEYNMLHPRRGKALIFNFFKFENNRYHIRIGSPKDVENLSSTLSYLGFDVETYDDLTSDALKAVLQQVAYEDHSDADCLCVVVMTHGHRNGELAAADLSFKVSDLWSPFTADKCKSLTGKPKLFFVQACRGSRQDPGSLVGRSIKKASKIKCKDHKSDRYKIPAFSDILLAFSSAHGFTSVRDVKKGSWFIQCLCQELRDNGSKHHLLTILTFVCQRVAVDYETVGGEKQMPTVVSMLTRLLYFRSVTKSKDSVKRRYLDCVPYRRPKTSRRRR